MQAPVFTDEKLQEQADICANLVGTYQDLVASQEQRATAGISGEFSSKAEVLAAMRAAVEAGEPTLKARLPEAHTSLDTAQAVRSFAVGRLRLIEFLAAEAAAAGA